MRLHSVYYATVIILLQFISLVSARWLEPPHNAVADIYLSDDTVGLTKLLASIEMYKEQGKSSEKVSTF